MSQPSYRRGVPPRARRRPAAQASFSGSRPDRIAAWAFVLGVLLIGLAATTSHADTGGAPAPQRETKVSGPDPLSDQLGRARLGEGSNGLAVETLQRILNAKSYGPVAETGSFDGTTKAAVQRFQHDRGLAIDGVVGPQTRPALLDLMQVRTATWYGPGFFGRRTACGRRLTPNTVGVAHKRLPCGTKVTFYANGRFVTAPVIDRGPYTTGVSWDLTEATARRLGVLATSRLRSLH